MSQDQSTTAAAVIAQLTPSQVMWSYSGKPGCGCGCKGSYRYNPAMVAAATVRRGYAIDAEEINLVSITKVLRTMQRRADEVQCSPMLSDTEMLFWVEDDQRYYWLCVPRMVGVPLPH